MRFRLKANIRQLYLHDPPGGKLELRVSGPHPILVRLRPPPERQKPGRLGEYARCEAIANFNPKPAILDGFRALEENKLPVGSGRPDPRWRTDPRLQHLAVMPALPEPMKQLIEQVERELETAATRAVELTRWRLGEDGPHQPFPRPKYQWAVGRSWRPMPMELHFYPRVYHVKPFTAKRGAEIQALVDSGVEPPLARSLCREAFQLEQTSPRSSLIIGVTALEVGVKQYLSRLVPELDWWLDEAPSPPILRLLTDYLPKLGGPEIDARLVKHLDSAIKARNRLVHTGKASKLRDERLKEALDAISDTLYSLDAAEGHGWAVRHMRLV